MISIRNVFHHFILLTAIALSSVSHTANASTGKEINSESALALQSLYDSNPLAKSIGDSAKGVLVFPRIIKAGLVIGGSYGEGALIRKGRFTGYYNSVSASWGWQAGAQSYGYVVFLMTDKAVKYLAKSNGWEFGVGPSVVVVNEGVAKNLSSTTLKDDAYAFIFDQKGLMIDVSITGTKISPIKR